MGRAWSRGLWLCVVEPDLINPSCGYVQEPPPQPPGHSLVRALWSPWGNHSWSHVAMTEKALSSALQRESVGPPYASCWPTPPPARVPHLKPCSANFSSAQFLPHLGGYRTRGRGRQKVNIFSSAQKHPSLKTEAPNYI